MLKFSYKLKAGVIKRRSAVTGGFIVMVNDTISKIKTVEITLEKEIENAKKAAADTVTQAKADSEYKIIKASSDAEKIISETVRKAEEKAVLIRKKHSAAAESTAKEMIEEAEKKSANAIAIVVQELIGQWQ